PQRLDQFLVLLTRHRTTLLGRSRAPLSLRARLAMLRRAAVTPHLDGAAGTFLLPLLLELQTMSLRAEVSLLLSQPAEVTLGDLLGVGHRIDRHRRVQRHPGGHR